jgi:hypothetical protein
MTIKSPKKKAAKPAEAVPAAFDPTLDCCNRNSADETHAPGCKSGLGGPASEAPAEPSGADEAPVPTEAAPALAPEPKKNGHYNHVIKPDSPVTTRDLAPESAAHQKRIAESREALKHPPEPGQAFFEAPDGYVIVGEADRAHVWYRYGNGGQGMWINPRREGTR